MSDELARNLDYDAAVDALGDIAIPALATWGYVAMTDERGRFSRVHMVTGDPADRELARRAGARRPRMAVLARPR